MCATVAQSFGGDGVGYALPQPFPCGSGDIIAAVGVADYCSTMRAYYLAVASFGAGQGLDFSERDRAAGLFGREHERGAVGRVVKVGSDVAESSGRSDGEANQCEDVSGCSSGLDGATTCGGSGGADGCGSQSVDTDDGVVFGEHGNGCDGVSRGRHWRRNRARRERKRKLESGEVCGRAVRYDGYFSSCSADLQVELRETRAKMLVEQNKASLLKAEVEGVRARALLEARLVETEVEQRRLKVDKWCKAASCGSSASGDASRVQTVSTSAGGSGMPSLTGSVSPSSSISVEELHKLERKCASLEVKVVELTDGHAKEVIGLKNQIAEFKKKDREFVEAYNSVRRPRIGGVEGYSRWEYS